MCVYFHMFRCMFSFCFVENRRKQARARATHRNPQRSPRRNLQEESEGSERSRGGSQKDAGGARVGDEGVEAC